MNSKKHFPSTDTHTDAHTHTGIHAGTHNDTDVDINVDADSLLREVDRLSQTKNPPRIALVGDLCLDEYVLGSCERLSPEAPVPVVHVDKREYRLGMTANVAYNILNLGGECRLFSVLGQDLAGEHLQHLLQEQGIGTENLLSLKERVTTRKSRVLAQQHHLIRLDEERRDPLTPSASSSLEAKIKEQLDECDFLILQDYAKGLFSENFMQSLIQECHRRKKRVLADPNPLTPLSFYRGVHFLKPNLKEAYQLSSKLCPPSSSTPSVSPSLPSLPSSPSSSPSQEAKKAKEAKKAFREALKALSQEIQQKIGSQSHIFITQGAEGISLLSQEGDFFHFPTQAQKVYDVTGAGDTVTACLGLFTAFGSKLETGCQLANFAAGQTLSQIGCGTCSLKELRDCLSPHNPYPCLSATDHQ